MLVESIQAGVPTLLFHSKTEYERALPFGQSIISELTKQGIVFYDIDSGLASFKRVLNNSADFIRDGERGIFCAKWS